MRFWPFMLLYCFLNIAAPHAKTNETLNISLLVASKGQRAAYHQLAEAFEQQHQNLRIVFTVQNDKQYKASIEKWLTQKNGFDVVYWQAGERMDQFASQGLLEPLDDLWQKNNWLTHFPQRITRTVQQGDSLYAAPFAFYQWSIYYKKSLFSRLAIEPPKTWSEFLVVCAALKSNGVTPIVVGGKEKWPVAAWFDYLNLRINGLAFHQQLMAGKIDYTEPRVKSVFSALKQLIDLGYFLSGSQAKNWQDAMPYVYRDLAGMTLLGSFVEQQFVEQFRDDIGFFRFPQIDSKLPLFEETPIEVFMIPKNAQNKPAARLFMSFIGRADIQEALSKNLGYLSPHLQATRTHNYHSNQEPYIFADNQDITQFYDRDTTKNMSVDGMQLMSDFIDNPDVSLITRKLEQVRLRSFPQADIK